MENKGLVIAAEESDISRYMLIWVNSYPDLPVAFVNYEQLKANVACMAMSVIQSAYITKRYVCGGHQAEYQFKLIYRIQPGTSDDKRLKCDEILNRFGDWAAQNLPDLGSMAAIKVEATTRAAVFDAYENGDEDHQILMKMTYEVV